MSYLGVPPFGQTVRTITESLATAGQTTFSPSGGYLPGYIDVFLNGSALGAADFTATNGSTVVLNVATALNDEFKAIAYWPVSLIDTYRKAEADALLAARVGTTSSVSMRNRIINGDMRIDQRNAGASVTLNNTGAYTLDRWYDRCVGGAGSAVITVQRSTTAPSGFTNSSLITVTTAKTPAVSEQFWRYQAIEGFNAADFAFGSASALSITMSFWVRSSVTGTYSVAFQNSAQNRSYVATYTVNAANTFEYKTITIAGDTSGTWLTDSGVGLYVFFDTGSGSNFNTTAGAWGAGTFYRTSGSVSLISNSGATFYITGVQLEAGTVASPFERRDYGRELMMCQRYYWRTESATSNQYLTSFYAATGVGDLYVPMTFPVFMRASPTVTPVLGSDISGVNAVVAGTVTNNQIRLTFTKTNTSGYYSLNSLQASAEL